MKIGRANLAPVGIWGCYYATLRKPSSSSSSSSTPLAHPSRAANPNKNVPLFDSTRHDIFIRIKRDRVLVPEEGIAENYLLFAENFFLPQPPPSFAFLAFFSTTRRVRLIKFVRRFRQIRLDGILRRRVAPVRGSRDKLISRRRLRHVFLGTCLSTCTRTMLPGG